MNINDIDKIFVVHCKDLIERKEYLLPKVSEFGPPVKWIIEFDPCDISIFTKIPVLMSKLSIGETSLYMKHMEVFRRIIEEDLETAFILEDDPVFNDDFLEVFEKYLLNLPCDWNMVFFGESCWQHSNKKVNEFFGIETCTRSTNGFIINCRTVKILLSELKEDKFIRKPIDIRINEILRKNEIITHWAEPAIIKNGTETGLFEHSLGVKRRIIKNKNKHKK